MAQSFQGDPLAELPLGLAMQLARDPAAKNAFSQLTAAEQAAMVASIQEAASTGANTKEFIARAVESLR